MIGTQIKNFMPWIEKLHAMKHQLIKVVITLAILSCGVEPCFAVVARATTPVTHHTIRKVRHHTRIKHPVRHIRHHTIIHHSTAHKTTAPATPQTAVVEPKPGFAASIGQSIAAFVQRTVATLHYTSYRFGGNRFDAKHGIYVLDCSDYVDHVLRAVYPHAYLSLVNACASDKPTSQNYYSFFTRLSDDPKHYWNRVNEVDHLQAGDILVFRDQNGPTEGGGHVMIVMSKPLHTANAFLVRVADSALAGHSHDTRRLSGIGIGTLSLRVDPQSGRPFAYAWKVGSRWENNVEIAMGRPV